MASLLPCLFCSLLFSPHTFVGHYKLTELPIVSNPILQVLASAGQSEYAVHILLNVLRYRPDDAHAHLEIFSTVHAAFEESKSLSLQLNMTRAAEDWHQCGLRHKVDKKYKKHKGLRESTKIEYIKSIAEEHGSRYMVETGTWYGETINAVKGQFEKIVSIEISSQLADHARRRFAKDANIQILNVGCYIS